jgi:hypothetical protein
MREIGIIKLVQIQRASLKLGEKPNKIYDPSPLLVVDSLRLSPQGVIGLTADGGQIMDVHNANHPDSKNRAENGISVGFTSHYAAMRARFGEHLVDGISGENILVDTVHQFELADLGSQLTFQNPHTGEVVYLDDLMVAAPCEPFSRFALRQAPPVEANVMKSTLQFLDGGMRGFYAVAKGGIVQAGDKVLIP